MTKGKDCCQYVLLTILIGSVWVLLALPAIFYHLPLPSHLLESNSTISTSACNMSNTTDPLSADQVCSLPAVYTGSVCHDTLQQYRICFSDSKHNSTILTSQDRVDQETKVANLIDLVKWFAYSKQCVNEAIPLVCLYYFGPLCDSEGRTYRLSKAQCVQASQGVCKREWKMASSYVPDCGSDRFGEETQLTKTCSFKKLKSFDKMESKGSHSNVTGVEIVGNCSLNCSKDFFCKPGTTSCVPTCDWKENTEPGNTIIDVFVILSVSLGTIFGVLTLISAAVRRKRLCGFPSVFVLYQTASIIGIGAIILVGYMNKNGLFCKGNDLIENIKHATPFCVISAIVTHYLLLHLTLWWLCHTAIMFWMLRFPFKAREYEIEKKNKYIHIACAVFCILASFIPIAVIMLVDWRQRESGGRASGTLGFGISRFPPIICTGLNRHSTYYSLVLPINFIVPVGVTLLILCVWLIHKHTRASYKERSDSPVIGRAEIRVIVVLCYYVLVTLVSLTGLTIISRNGPLFAKEVFSYFACEQGGYSPDHSCDRLAVDLTNQPGLVAVSFMFVGLFPLVNFIFSTNFVEIKDALVKCCCRQPETEESEKLLSKASVKSTKATDTGHTSD